MHETRDDILKALRHFIANLEHRSLSRDIRTLTVTMSFCQPVAGCSRLPGTFDDRGISNSKRFSWNEEQVIKSTENAYYIPFH